MNDVVKSPEGYFVADQKRPGPDVSKADVAAAAGGEQAITGDWWFKSGRKLVDYRQEAADTALRLGYDLPKLSNISQGMMSPTGGYNPGLSPEQVLDQQLDAVLMKARKEHPQDFAGMPLTAAEMEAQVTEDLKGELADVQETLGLAPDTFMGGTLPDFVGRVIVSGTDQVNAPLTLLTAGYGAGASIARTIGMEAAINMGGEALSLPAQYRMADRLDTERPDAAQQILMAGAFGAAVPLAFRGVAEGGRALAAGVRVTNAKLAETLRARATDLSDAERGALHEIERGIASDEAGPAPTAADRRGSLDSAREDLEEGRINGGNIATDPARVEALVRAPEAGPPAPAEDLRTAARKPKVSVEASLGALIRDAEARGSYDTISDYSVVTPDKPITEMTLDEIDAFQTANIEGGAESSAIGGPQILRDTLRDLRSELGLTGSEKFTPALQDRLMLALMERRGLADFKEGRITVDQFADNLAQEWAALPLADGMSYYRDDGLNAATIDRDTLMGVLSGDGYDAIGRPPLRMTRIPASTVRVDPKAYQFRTEVDASGVGTPLDRVSEWDELLAGDFIIHERFDGARYVADGHHRTDLARRLEAGGHAPIDFNGFVLREADGYSVEHVRAIAAVKNIEAGNASAIDAAKVLRVDPAMLEKLSLRSAQARDARGLMNLTDEGFDMVTNGLVDESHAAFVGALTRDGEMQDALLATLMRTRPRSLAEARQIAQDAQRAGLMAREKSAQGSLFGDDWGGQETLFKERARILASAFSQLRQDSRIFRTLVAEQDRIAAAGNRLDTATNQQRAVTDETALALIEKLVNRAGPLDDALTAAARRVRAGASLAGGTRDFTGTVRRAIEGGDLRRLLSGADGDGAHVAGPDGPAPEGAGAGIGRGAEEALAPSPAAARVGLGDAFDDPSPAAPAVANQTAALENDLRAAFDRGEDLLVPTGREIDGAAELVSARDLFDDMDADQDFLGALDVCKY